MTAKLDGTNGVIFPDGTTQSTAGVAPTSTQLCKAWVNFNGVTSTSIRASYNVSSVTRNGTGDYTINFTNALTDANYCAIGQRAYETGNTAGANVQQSNLTSPTSSAWRFYTLSANNAVPTDSTYVEVSFFR